MNFCEDFDNSSLDGRWNWWTLEVCWL